MNLWCLFFSLSGQNSKNFIKNGDVPLCKDCKHFLPYSIPLQYQLGKCKKFGMKNIFSGEITYEYIEIVRNFDECGVNGTYFEEKPPKWYSFPFNRY
jgi:hypothetical protein